MNNNELLQQAAESNIPLLSEKDFSEINQRKNIEYVDYCRIIENERRKFIAGAKWKESQQEGLLVSAIALFNSHNLSNYPEMKPDALVIGYYVKCRGGHYILQEYNNNGYDERWETSEFVEIDFDTLKFVNNE